MVSSERPSTSKVQPQNYKTKCHPHFTNSDVRRSKQTGQIQWFGGSETFLRVKFLHWQMEWLGPDNILRKTNLGEIQQTGQALGKMALGTIKMQLR